MLHYRPRKMYRAHHVIPPNTVAENSQRRASIASPAMTNPISMSPTRDTQNHSITLPSRLIIGVSF